MGILKKVFGNKKTKEEIDTEMKAEVLKKATQHMKTETELANTAETSLKKTASEYQNIDQAKKQNIRSVLLEVVNRGEAGVLSTSISDKVGISKNDVTAALAFLTDKKYVEAVNSPVGMKYYLTSTGRKHCLSQEFNSN